MAHSSHLIARGFYRSYLYVPGNRPDLAAKAYRTGADAVIIDLEDAVPPAQKAEARRTAVAILQNRPAGSRPASVVRINAVTSEEACADVAAVVSEAVSIIRIPKVETPDDAKRVVTWAAEAEAHAGLPECSIGLQLGIESARGVLNAASLAVDPRVVGLFLGAADLTADLGLVGENEEGTRVARSLLVLASAAAGLQPPVESVYTHLRDLNGLQASTEASKRLGFFGRAAVHPAQVPIINEVFTPTPAEIETAQALIDRLTTAALTGNGALQLPDGRLVDAAIVRQAQRVLALAALGTEY